jgi:hypothetical protein
MARTLAAMVASLVLGLTPLAYAEAPDPTWWAGYSQDDDVATVLEVILTSWAIERPAALDTHPFWAPVERADPADSGIAARPVGCADAPRGPPVAPLRPA